MRADVQLRITIERNSRCAAGGCILKGNHATFGAAHSAVRGDVRIGGGTGVEEEQGRRGQASSHPAINDKSGIVGRGHIVEEDEAAMFADRASPNGGEGAFSRTGK